jgi:carbamoyl-phosphate synthase small subunit
VGGLIDAFESNQIHIQGLIMTDYSFEYSHWNAEKSLDMWMQEHNVVGLYGMDTRKLTKKLRQRGSMLGKIVTTGQDRDFYDPNRENLVQLVSVKESLVYGNGKKQVVLIDCGGKFNIIRSLVGRGVQVKRVPWDYDFLSEDFDGVMISNGPGDPQMCQATVALVRKLLEGNRPVFGICLGHQILSLAAGAETYKMKFGHRSQNQPCMELGTPRCYITSQNHGFAVKPNGLSSDWTPWFVNANDGSNEGIRHQTKPFMSVQFHPEATPGPTDTSHLFDRFIDLL